MDLSEEQITFLDQHHSAAMTTYGQDGLAKIARVGVALVDGKLQSSSARDRLRTKRLRRDPRCTLFVFEPQFAWLGLDTTVRIIDGPEAPEANLKLMRTMQAKPTGPVTWMGAELEDDAFVNAMVAAGRLVYEFDINHAYGMINGPS